MIAIFDDFYAYKGFRNRAFIDKILVVCCQKLSDIQAENPLKYARV